MLLLYAEIVATFFVGVAVVSACRHVLAVAVSTHNGVPAEEVKVFTYHRPILCEDGLAVILFNDNYTIKGVNLSPNVLLRLFGKYLASLQFNFLIHHILVPPRCLFSVHAEQMYKLL